VTVPVPDFRAEIARSGVHEMTISLRVDDLPAPVRDALLRAIGDDRLAAGMAGAFLDQVSEPFDPAAGPGPGRGFTAAPVLIRVARLRATEVRAEALVELGTAGRQVYA